MNFALKRISSEKFHDSEIECMLQIRSPYTVTLYKYVRSGEYVYLILEYCPNSLDKIIIQNPRLPLEKQLKMAFGMVLALKGCHEFGISHGDIKPSNFLIDNYGRIKICDFGLSQKITEEPNTINLVGTLAYRSPEMIKMQPYDGFAADIWSLGVSLFILCTGTYPWNISSREKMLKSITNGIFDESLIKDPTLKEIIVKCLQVDPKKRPTAHEITDMIRIKPVEARKKLVRAVHSSVYTTSVSRSNTIRRIRKIQSF